MRGGGGYKVHGVALIWRYLEESSRRTARIATGGYDIDTECTKKKGVVSCTKTWDGRSPFLS